MSDLTDLTSLKVSSVSDTVTQFLATVIKGMGVERGYNIDLFEADNLIIVLFLC